MITQWLLTAARTHHVKVALTIHGLIPEGLRGDRISEALLPMSTLGNTSGVTTQGGVGAVWGSASGGRAWGAVMATSTRSADFSSDPPRVPAQDMLG